MYLVHKLMTGTSTYRLSGRDKFVQLIVYFMQLTVVYRLPHNVDLWRATMIQQKVQRCSTAVTNIWFQRGG